MAKHLVIMAGGIGSRFWPMSTPQCPKQFLDITGSGKTMIQQTFERYTGIIDIEHLWVVTSKNYKDLVLSQLEGINPQHVLLEPGLKDCIVAEHNNVLLICQLKEEQRIKEWHD